MPVLLSKKSDRGVESLGCRLCKYSWLRLELGWCLTCFTLLGFWGARTAIANTLIQAWATNSYLDDRGPGAGAASNAAGGAGTPGKL